MSVLGCCETGVLAGDQLELDELAMFDDAVEPIGSDLAWSLAVWAYRW
jgi:hypothetical protein